VTGRRNHLFRRTKRAIYFTHPQLNLVGQFMEPESGRRIAGFIRQAMAFDDLVLDSDQMIQNVHVLYSPLERAGAQHSHSPMEAGAGAMII